MVLPSAAWCAEARSHAHGVISYVVALGWTNFILPLLGGPVVVHGGVAEMMHHKFYGPYLAFVWLYVALVTKVCWWWYVVGEQHAAANMDSTSTLLEEVRRGLWSQMSGSMAWVAMWAWLCATLGSLPTFTPLEAVGSAALITIGAAFAILSGQMGDGPLRPVLHDAHHAPKSRLQTVIFFTTWMTASAWVGALTVCVAPFGAPSWAAAWLVALILQGTRWMWLWRWARSGTAASHALGVYAARPEASLTVGLVADDSSSAERPHAERPI